MTGADRAFALSPLDGRYADKVAPLAERFSEFALMRSRCRVEVAYLQALCRTGLVPALGPDELARADRVAAGFGAAEFARIKEHERTTHHDVKACELFLRERLELANPDLIHFGLTSEDVNNLAWSLMLRDYADHAQRPLVDALIVRLCDLADRWKAAPFPARTHGQLASPTTAGKELAVYASRLTRLRGRLAAFGFRGKLAGATGNYSAMLAAFPEHDWPAFARRFVESLGLEHNPVTTQVEDHDAWAEYLDLTRRIGNVVLDLALDMWLYISHGYFKGVPQPGQVGSSTMPHKVNPIRFENGEGNLHLAGALLVQLADRLSRSRMQRDLSDSTLTRNLGVALGHWHLGLSEVLAGLGRVELDQERCRAELDASPELLAEPIQTVLRLTGTPDPYELLRRFTQGASPSRDELDRFVAGLAVDEATRARLSGLSVTGYVGAAERICTDAVERARREVSP